MRSRCWPCTVCCILPGTTTNAIAAEWRARKRNCVVCCAFHQPWSNAAMQGALLRAGQGGAN